MDHAQTQILGLVMRTLGFTIHYQALYALHPLHTQSMYNNTQNLCLGNTKMCLVMAKHILVKQLGI
jgi:hypothetical protein